MKLLIVNADDFGLNDATNDGIVESHAVGAVTSTTLMVNAPRAERAAELARQNPRLGVGLHFNLTWGRPLSGAASVPALVDQGGNFLSRDVLARRLLLRKVPLEQVARELGAQVKRFAELGLEPTHLDSHQHIHAFGVVFSAIAQHCSAAGIPMRVPWVAPDADAALGRRIRRLMLGALLERATKPWRDRVRWNDGLGSVFDVGANGGPLEDADYERVLARARGHAVELMVHPVTSARAMEGYTKIGAVSEAEWRYLRTGRLTAVVRAAGFRLATYRDLTA